MTWLSWHYQLFVARLHTAHIFSGDLKMKRKYMDSPWKVSTDFIQGEGQCTFLIEQFIIIDYLYMHYGLVYWSTEKTKERNKHGDN